MEYNHKVEERKLYFRYFRVWIIIVMILLVVFGGLFLAHKDDPEDVLPDRNNNEAPTQRVYDFADVLTDQEEKKIESVIAEYEEYGRCDLVLVTINQEVGDYTWEENMVSIADDFYDRNAFGFDQPHGDGALLLDNWYHAGQSDSQAGAWLSTSGTLEYEIGSSEESDVFGEMDEGFEESAAEGYIRALKKVAYYGRRATVSEPTQIPIGVVIVVPIVIALIYALANMSQAPGKDTTTNKTYVPGGQPHVNAQRDDFLRKNVTKVKIETESSSRSGGGGSYGHHTSSGGYSHGGGGHRR